jgi:hypothetical protein
MAGKRHLTWKQIFLGFPGLVDDRFRRRAVMRCNVCGWSFHVEAVAVDVETGQFVCPISQCSGQWSDLKLVRAEWSDWRSLNGYAG